MCHGENISSCLTSRPSKITLHVSTKILQALYFPGALHVPIHFTLLDLMKFLFLSFCYSSSLGLTINSSKRPLKPQVYVRPSDSETRFHIHIKQQARLYALCTQESHYFTFRSASKLSAFAETIIIVAGISIRGAVYSNRNSIIQ